MSDWRRALEDRREHLDAVHHHIEQSQDEFIDHEDAGSLSRARDRVEEVIDHTDEEIDLADADWHEVQSHASEIVSLLGDALELLAEDGLIEYDDETFRIEAALDDEPEEIASLRRYIETTYSDWYEVRSACDENTGRY